MSAPLNRSGYPPGHCVEFGSQSPAPVLRLSAPAHKDPALAIRHRLTLVPTTVTAALAARHCAPLTGSPCSQSLWPPTAMAIGGARPTIALLLGCLLEPLNGARHPGYPPSADLLFWLLAMRLFCLQVAAHHWIICPRSSTACPSTTTPAALATRHRPGLCIDRCRYCVGYSPLLNDPQPLWLRATTVIG